MEELLEKSEDIFELVKQIAEDRIPFNRQLGLKVDHIDHESFVISFAMREELMGNFIQKTLHGGVISATLDVVGGLTAFLSVIRLMEDQPLEERLMRFSKIGTVDMRVDYLRPGRGDTFRATGYLLRTGNKLSVTRMELHDDQDRMIAVGTGTYLIG